MLEIGLYNKVGEVNSTKVYAVIVTLLCLYYYTTLSKRV